MGTAFASTPSMNQLVLNLTRFGDLLQTQPLVSGLKATGARTGLVFMGGLEQAVGLLSFTPRFPSGINLLSPVTHKR